MKYLVRSADTSKTSKASGTNEAIPVKLYSQAGTAGLTAGASLLRAVKRARLQPTSRAWDFLSIALAAAVADTATLRRSSADGWTREISLDISLIEPEVWEPHLPLLTTALAFLTTDVWRIETGSKADIPLQLSKKAKAPAANCVALLSGGLDSLIGGIDLIDAGQTPYFVSHTVRGEGAKQREFAGALGSGLAHIQLNHNASTRGVVGPAETSQRVRSLIFIAYGVLVASTLESPDGERVDLYINENGFIAINPPLTPMRVGSLSTRTAHPRFLALLQELLDASGLNVRLINPYRLLSKGQMAVDCRDQPLLTQLAPLSTSCGRFQRYNYQHCGRCLPCQVRRAAFLRWGQADPTDYVFADLGLKDEDHAGFDDVRAVAMALLAVQEDGFETWAGGSLAWVSTTERDAAKSMLIQSLAELGALHDHYHVT